MQINQLPAASSLNNQDKFAVDTTDGITKSITASQLVELTRTNSYGAPLAAGTAAAMTDTSKVYVYTGNETGYTNGDWYYYNGTAWVSGGAYNSVAVNTDKTLRLSGVAADAKAVGDANAALSADILTVSGDLEEATEKIYSDIATDYDNLTWPVSAGQYCIYLGRTYKANQDIPTIESWNASHWTRTNLGEGLSDLGDVQGDIAGLQAAIASEASARQAADTSLNNAISAEASAREATDTALNGSIIAEATAREAADDELKSALNIINPPLDITWTLGIGINSSGVEYSNRYTAATNAIYATPGDVFATDSPTVDSNGKFLVYYVCEYAGSVFKKRTEFTNTVRSVVTGADTDNIRVVFGRYGSSGITITQADIDTYVSIKFTQKAGAASLVKALADKVDNLDTDTFIINRYAYQGNDVNDIAENTFYFCAEGTINNPSTQGGYFIQTILYRNNAAAAMQIAYRFDNGLIYYRRKVSGTWRSWLCVSSHSIPSAPLYYAFGDSLTYGAVWTPKEEAPYYQITQASVANQIPTRIANAIGAAGNYQNKGVGGSYFVGTGNNKIITAIQNTNLTNAKIITIAGGRNDSENPLGDKNSTVGDGTICGAIKEILEYLTTTYKQLQIVWIGVTPNTRDNSTVFTRVFAGGWSLNTFDEKVSELCAEYGVPYVNWKECTYIRHWADFSGAGDVYSHPNNENSYLQMGNYIAGKVSAFYKG